MSGMRKVWKWQREQRGGLPHLRPRYMTVGENQSLYMRRSQGKQYPQGRTRFPEQRGEWNAQRRSWGYREFGWWCLNSRGYNGRISFNYTMFTSRTSAVILPVIFFLPEVHLLVVFLRKANRNNGTWVFAY